MIFLVYSVHDIFASKGGRVLIQLCSFTDKHHFFCQPIQVQPVSALFLSLAPGYRGQADMGLQTEFSDFETHSDLNSAW